MSEDSKVLVPVEQKTIDFYGDQIKVVLMDYQSGGTVYLPIRRICDFLGVAWPQNAVELIVTQFWLRC